MLNSSETRSRATGWSLLPFLLLAAGCAYAILYCSSTRDVSGHAIASDDAYISYRYARNFVDGHGLVFNVGERVEGFTNLLYVLLMSVPFAAGVNVYWFSMVINSLFALGALAVLMNHLRTRLGSNLSLLGGLLFALSPSIWIWVCSGLETPLVLLCQTTIWSCAERLEDRATRRDLLLLCLAVGTLILTRADGFITGGIVTAYFLVKGNWRTARPIGATLVVVLGCVFAWRLSYYHMLWPNTYYAKVTSSVLSRVRAAIKEFGGIGSRQGLAIYLVTIVFCAARALSGLRAGLQAALLNVRFGTAFGVTWICYWLFVGGDNFEDRFLIVLIPIGIALLLEEMLGASEALTRRFVVVAAIVIQLSVPVREDQYGKSLTPKYDYRVLLGQFLAKGSPARLLATPAAGKIPYFSGLKTIDMLGLTDAVIGRKESGTFVPGHSKHDDDYVLSLKPDLIATTFTGDGLDAGEGLPVEKYKRAGYRIRYVINSLPRSMAPDDILDAVGRSDSELIIRAHSGWRQVVLERSVGAGGPSPSAP